MRIAIFAAVLGVALAGPALAQQTPPPAVPMANTASPADRAFSSAMDKMNQQMSMEPMTGNTDQDFVTMMLPHHEGAVAMAKLELEYGKDAYLKQMARDIITAQDKEIAEMHAWQARHPPSK